jgi:hypothetical protein
VRYSADPFRAIVESPIMSRLHSFTPGGYSFLEGGFPYSQGVIAQPGFAIVRARFADAPTVKGGFERIASHLAAEQRPLTALCAAELRSPTPFTLEGFREFNLGYVDVLKRWGLVSDASGGLNPVARSNVCPVFDPPAQPQFHAFCYTVPSEYAGAVARASDFVVAGSGEWPEGSPFPDGVVARGDATASGVARKAAHVQKTMRTRCAGLAADWSRLTAAQVYTEHDIHPLLGPLFAANGLTSIGLTWQVCRPPIIELEFEMDVRCVATERVI